MACTLVSAKYIEPDENLPKLSTLQRLVGHGVSWDRVVRAEEEILIMLDWQMELQMPHNYLRFMKTFGYILADDSCEEAIIPKMAKYVHVFLDLVFYERTHLLFTNLQLALACVVCVRRYYSLGKPLHPTLLELYGAGTENEKGKV